MRGGRASVRQWKLGQDTHRDPYATGSPLHPGAGGRQTAEDTQRAWSGLVSKLLMEYSSKVGTQELLLRLAVGRMEHCPFPAGEVSQLREQVQQAMEQAGHGVRRTNGDRTDVPIDFRLLQSLLSAAEDPEVGLGDFATGVRVGPGARLPRLPALYVAKRRWRLPEQEDPLEYQQEERGARAHGRGTVLAVMDDQSSRGQVLKLREEEARARFPNLVVASLGALKDKPDGTVTARVLFDGTHGIQVNRRTRIRDQERTPIASDLKSSMREKAKVGERTFALTADVKEAHRQVPVAPRDWHLLGARSSRAGTCM